MVSKYFVISRRQIIIPEIRSDISGFNFISYLSQLLGNYSNVGNIDVDFRNVNWIDAHMLAPLGACLYKHRQNGNDVMLSNLNPQIDSILRKNGFLSFFNNEVRTRDKWGTIIPYRRFSIVEERTFPNYITKLAKNRDNLRFNDKSRESLIFTTLELFNNAVSHSRSSAGVFVCGQYHPNAHILRFCLSDAGEGIRNNVSGFIGKAVTSEEAILWALERGNSTRIDRPGGMGLHFLDNFARNNLGNLHIVSGNAVVTTGAQCHTQLTDGWFSGTYICMEINTNKASSYLYDDSSEELDDEIF